MSKRNGWTKERRKAQSERIRQWEPWTHSTGPRTEEGKDIVSANAFKGGFRERLRELNRITKEFLRAKQSRRV